MAETLAEFLGLAGPGGTAVDKTYTHTQTVPATQWVIAHGMQKRPVVMMEDDTGEDVIADVDYISDLVLHINFSKPTAGVAHLN